MSKTQRRYDILIVEDNPGDYILIEDFLQETALTRNIKWAESFQSAAEVLSKDEVKIDLIFLDLSLPDLQGEELIQEIQKLTNNKPIIILTGYTDTSFAVKSLSLGASDYLVKDVLNPTVLLKSIIYNIERNKILVNLKDSEKQYSDLFHFSPLPLWVFDQDTFQFLDVNDASTAHYGYSYDEFLAMDISEIMDKQSIHSFKNILDSFEETHHNIFLGLQNHIKKDGKTIQVELRANSYVYNGRPAKIISIHDVTEKNQQMQAIQKQNEILKEIAWTQSHVVRAPVARLMGIVNIMKNKEINDSDKDVFYDHLFNSALELDEIIKSVVDKSQEVNINNPKK